MQVAILHQCFFALAFLVDENQWVFFGVSAICHTTPCTINHFDIQTLECTICFAKLPQPFSWLLVVAISISSFSFLCESKWFNLFKLCNLRFLAEFKQLRLEKLSWVRFVNVRDITTITISGARRCILTKHRWDWDYRDFKFISHTLHSKYFNHKFCYMS